VLLRSIGRLQGQAGKPRRQLVPVSVSRFHVLSSALAAALCSGAFVLGILASAAYGCAGDDVEGTTTPAFALDIEFNTNNEQVVQPRWATPSDHDHVYREDRQIALRRTFETRDEAMQFDGSWIVAIGENDVAQGEVAFGACDAVIAMAGDTMRAHRHTVHRVDFAYDSATDRWEATAADRGLAHARLSCYQDVQKMLGRIDPNLHRLRYELWSTTALAMTWDGEPLTVQGLGIHEGGYSYDLLFDWPLEADVSMVDHTVAFFEDGRAMGALRASFNLCSSCGARVEDFREQQMTLERGANGEVTVYPGSCVCYSSGSTCSEADGCSDTPWDWP